MIESIVFAALIAAAPSPAFKVEVFPAGRVYLNRANADHHYVDLVVHNILFINDSGRPLDVERAFVEVLAGDTVVERRTLTRPEIQATTAEIAANGQVATAQLDTDFPWPALRERNLTLAAGAHLLPHQVAAIKNVYMTVSGEPTSVRVRATASNAEASVTLPIARGSANRYSPPVRGVWYMRSIPDITSHHRWNAPTEFAVDFFKMGENGLPWKSDGRSAADFYGFGAPVLAAADGVVVALENTAVQNYDVRLRKEGESDEAYGRRLTEYNIAMMKADPYKAMIGNYVVIQHANGEFSSYAHLKTGSVAVQKGERVTAGQQIAAIGDTGDTNLVHLHFEVSDGPDPVSARSIPFTFTGLFPPGGDLGRIVRTP
jgi:murein DD-endopeptidase MepM/ murein hydrolase activator NlpD